MAGELTQPPRGLFFLPAGGLICKITKMPWQAVIFMLQLPHDQQLIPHRLPCHVEQTLETSECCVNLPGFLFLPEVLGVRCDQAGQDLPETATEQWS